MQTISEQFSVERIECEVEAAHLFDIVVELEKFVLGIDGVPDALVIAIPSDGPRNVAHQKFIGVHPAGDFLDFRRIIWRVGNGRTFRRQQVGDERLTRDDDRHADDCEADLWRRRFHLVEQRKKKGDAKNHRERREQHEQIFRINFRRDIGKLCFAQCLRYGEHAKTHHCKITQPPRGDVSQAQQQSGKK